MSNKEQSLQQWKEKWEKGPPPMKSHGYRTGILSAQEGHLEELVDRVRSLPTLQAMGEIARFIERCASPEVPPEDTTALAIASWNADPSNAEMGSMFPYLAGFEAGYRARNRLSRK